MPPARAQTTAPPTIDDAAVLISKLGHRAKRRFQTLLEPTGLRTNQAQVIAYVYDHAGVSQRDLVAALHVTPSMVVELVDHLERGGYVVRERRVGDRRSWAVRLTSGGERVRAQVLEISAQVEDELLAPLEGDDRERLLGYLRTLDRGFTAG